MVTMGTCFSLCMVGASGVVRHIHNALQFGIFIPVIGGGGDCPRIQYDEGTALVGDEN